MNGNGGDEAVGVGLTGRRKYLCVEREDRLE